MKGVMCLGDLYTDATLTAKWRCVWEWVIDSYFANQITPVDGGVKE